MNFIVGMLVAMALAVAGEQNKIKMAKEQWDLDLENWVLASKQRDIAKERHKLAVENYLLGLKKYEGDAERTNLLHEQDLLNEKQRSLAIEQVNLAHRKYELDLKAFRSIWCGQIQDTIAWRKTCGHIKK